MAAQAAWLRRARTEELRSEAAKKEKELRRAETVPEEAEFGHIEELRRKMAQQAAHLAEQAREVTRRFSDSLQPDTDSPEAKPSKLPAAATESSDSAESDDGEEKATPRKPPLEVAPSREGVPNEGDAWSRASESVSKATSDMVTIAGEVAAGVAALFSSWSPSWSSPPIREEAKPMPANCPRCGKAMPGCVGANFCPHCNFVLT